MKVHGINLQEIVILYVDGQQTIHFYLKNELKRDFIFKPLNVRSLS